MIRTGWSESSIVPKGIRPETEANLLFVLSFGFFFYFCFVFIFLSSVLIQPSSSPSSCRAACVAQPVAHLTQEPDVPGSISGPVIHFRFSFCRFKKGSCQFLAKVCPLNRLVGLSLPRLLLLLLHCCFTSIINI